MQSAKHLYFNLHFLMYTQFLFSDISYVLNSYECKPNLNTLRRIIEKIKTVIDKIDRC